VERLKLKYGDAANALETFVDILKEPYSVIVRDASIQRFEYTFEAVWKMLKELLKEDAGIIINSPKEVFREIFSIGIVNEDEAGKCLEMCDRRNDTAHTYKEEMAEKIFAGLNGYCKLMKKILKTVKEKLSD